MPYGPVNYFVKTMSSGGTLTGSYDLSKSWNKVYLEVPTMASASDIYIQGSADNSTFRRIYTESKQGYQVKSVSIASGITLTSEIVLDQDFEDHYLYIPTMASATDIMLQGSFDNSTFKRIMHPAINSATVAINTFIVASGLSQRFVQIPFDFPYIKVELSTGTTDTTTTFRVMSKGGQGLRDFVIPSHVTNRMVPIPADFRYIKVELSTGVTDATLNFNVICKD